MRRVHAKNETRPVARHIPGHEWRKLPKVQSEWTTTKERGEQARRWLADKQRVKPVFSQFVPKGTRPLRGNAG